jgi:5-methylcytosine-specific restriction endonuclease McrA
MIKTYSGPVGKKRNYNVFDRAGLYTIEYVFETIKNSHDHVPETILIDGYMVKKYKKNLDIYRKSIKCSACGIEGKYFALEKQKDHKVWHFRLYGIDKCQNEVMLNIDHILPKARGGVSSYSNLQTMCEFCNGKKGNMIIEHNALSTIANAYPEIADQLSDTIGTSDTVHEPNIPDNQHLFNLYISDTGSFYLVFLGGNNHNKIFINTDLEHVTNVRIEVDDAEINTYALVIDFKNKNTNIRSCYHWVFDLTDMDRVCNLLTEIKPIRKHPDPSKYNKWIKI